MILRDTMREYLAWCWCQESDEYVSGMRKKLLARDARGERKIYKCPHQTATKHLTAILNKKTRDKKLPGLYICSNLRLKSVSWAEHFIVCQLKSNNVEEFHYVHHICKTWAEPTGCDWPGAT